MSYEIGDLNPRKADPEKTFYDQISDKNARVEAL